MHIGKVGWFRSFFIGTLKFSKNLKTVKIGKETKDPLHAPRSPSIPNSSVTFWWMWTSLSNVYHTCTSRRSVLTFHACLFSLAIAPTTPPSLSQSLCLHAHIHTRRKLETRAVATNICVTLFDILKKVGDNSRPEIGLR